VSATWHCKLLLNKQCVVRMRLALRGAEGTHTVLLQRSRNRQPPTATLLPVQMPLLYTASTVAAKRVQNPAFTRRGLDGLTSGRLEQIQHVGLAAEKQIAYDGYITNLPAFLHATSSQKRVTTAHGWFLARIDIDKLIPIPFPPLVLSSRTPFPNEEAKNKFKLSLGEGVEEIRSPKGMTFVIRNVTADTLKKLPYSSIDPNTLSPNDATSLTGLKSFVLTLKIISLFLATHTYPYKQVADDHVNRYGFDSSIIWPKEEQHYSGKMMRGQGDAKKVVRESEALTDADIEGVGETSDGYPNSAENATFVAKPAPLRPDVNYGEPSATPFFPGYVLPYFPGIIEPSKHCIINVIRRFFLGCLADSKEKSTDAWYEWVRGVDKWYQTAAGKAVTHILFNIQTALEAQARVFLYIRNREYIGSAILGFGSGIMVEGKSILPETADVVRVLAGQLDDHGVAMAKIVTMINGIRRDASLMEMVESDLNSARKLYRFISEAPQVPKEEITELTSLIAKLSFEDKLWSAAVTNLVKALDLLSCDDPVDDLPMYLSPDLIYDTTRAHQVLSAFGPLAPSFVEAIGQEFPIPKGPLDADPASQVDGATGKRPLETIYISLKKLPVAVGDWTNVVKKRRIRINTEKRDAGFRTIGYHGEMRDQIWRSLKKIPYSEPGKKRQRDEDMGEGSDERAAKKGKAKADSVEITYDSFF
jgi:hypothetical protein